MNAERKMKALRIAALSFVGAYSKSELKRLASELEGDKDFSTDLSKLLHALGGALYDSDGRYETKEFSYDDYQADQLYVEIQRRRLSKQSVLLRMAESSNNPSYTEFSKYERVTMREILRRFMLESSAGSVRRLMLSLGMGFSKDDYLEGISSKREKKNGY